MPTEADTRTRQQTRIIQPWDAPKNMKRRVRAGSGTLWVALHVLCEIFNVHFSAKRHGRALSSPERHLPRTDRGQLIGSNPWKETCPFREIIDCWPGSLASPCRLLNLPFHEMAVDEAPTSTLHPSISRAKVSSSYPFSNTRFELTFGSCSGKRLTAC